MQKVITESIKKDFLIYFGKHICNLRKLQNLSQVEFAERCNTNIHKVGRTEKGI